MGLVQREGMRQAGTRAQAFLHPCRIRAANAALGLSLLQCRRLREHEWVSSTWSPRREAPGPAPPRPSARPGLISQGLPGIQLLPSCGGHQGSKAPRKGPGVRQKTSRRRAASLKPRS